MPNKQLDLVLRHLHCVLSASCIRDAGDAELLERFVRTREEAAFAALVAALAQGALSSFFVSNRSLRR